MAYLGDDRHNFFLSHSLQQTDILFESLPHFQQGNTLMEEGKRQELMTDIK
jgi:hypothetical protein